MKKLLPLMLALALAACAGEYCNKPCQDMCAKHREPLSERTLGSTRGNNNVIIQYNDQDYKKSSKGFCSHCDKMKGESGKANKRTNKTYKSAPVDTVTEKKETKPAKKGLFF